MTRHLALVCLLSSLFVAPVAAQSLQTKWAKAVDPARVHPEYPRPHFVRERWQNLNGPWKYVTLPAADRARPEHFQETILVPFPYESALSGVKKRMGENEALWYRRTFEIPAEWSGQPIRLHFGAVDWHSQVFVNGQEVGEHRGGYDPFSFDITSALRGDGEQELVVRVADPTDKGPQPRGKQINRPHGIWYTPITGIWQTVWIEPVPTQALEHVHVETDSKADAVTIRVTSSAKSGQLKLKITDQGQPVAEATVDADPAAAGGASDRRTFTFHSGDARLKRWSPQSPQLYDLQLQLVIQDRVVDQVDSYFGVRTIRLGQDAAGVTRILLNGKFVFQYGLLDQGFWPDGLYTAPTDEALRYDLEVTKRLGFNMVRKHVKVEPARWYYHCDKMGLIVWQDMPSGDRYIGQRDPDIERTEESRQQFETEWSEILRDFGHFPSIVMWVPFNEGWGQFDTARIAKWTKELDPTRLVNSASGWTDRGVGDVHDIHVYPGPAMPPLSSERAAVLGEFGGLGLPIEGHTWQDKNNWGYRSFTTREALNDSYAQLMARLRVLVSQGLSAAVYTQTTDVEIEVNGLLTYDRAVLKMDERRVQDLHRKLHLPPPEYSVVVPSSREKPVEWRFTTEKPAENWTQPNFDDAAWKQGPGGFGEATTPGSVVRTPWKSPDLWLRREIEFPSSKLEDLQLLIHHDEDTEVYLDGKLVARTTGYTTEYVVVPLNAETVKSLTAGRHTLAVHCHQTGGGQYIDVGFVEAKEPAAADHR